MWMICVSSTPLLYQTISIEITWMQNSLRRFLVQAASDFRVVLVLRLSAGSCYPISRRAWLQQLLFPLAPTSTDSHHHHNETCQAVWSWTLKQAPCEILDNTGWLSVKGTVPALYSDIQATSLFLLLYFCQPIRRFRKSSEDTDLVICGD